MHTDLIEVLFIIHTYSLLTALQMEENTDHESMCRFTENLPSQYSFFVILRIASQVEVQMDAESMLYPPNTLQ